MYTLRPSVYADGGANLNIELLQWQRPQPILFSLRSFESITGIKIERLGVLSSIRRQGNFITCAREWLCIYSVCKARSRCSLVRREWSNRDQHDRIPPECSCEYYASEIYQLTVLQIYRQCRSRWGDSSIPPLRDIWSMSRQLALWIGWCLSTVFGHGCCHPICWCLLYMIIRRGKDLRRDHNFESAKQNG